MNSEESILRYPTSVYQTDRVSAYLALVMPLVPLYIVAGIGVPRYASNWIFWAISVPMLAIVTYSSYKIFDCSRSKKIELYGDNETLIVYGFIYPLGFFDIAPKKQVILQYSDICGTTTMTRRGVTSYTIYTHDSQFRFLDHIDRSMELFSLLTSMADQNNHPESKSQKSSRMMIRGLWISVGVLVVLAFLYALVTEIF